MADRYWVGGGSTANWNATGDTNWSDTSGGSNNASVPTSSDDVFFDGNSPDSTISAAITIRSLNCTGYTNTLTHNSSVALTIGIGDVLLSSGMTYTPLSSSSLISFSFGSNRYNKLTTNGQQLRALTVTGSGGKIVQLQDDLYVLGTINLVSGFIDKNDFKMTCGLLSSSNTGLRGITEKSIPNMFTGSGRAINGGTASSGETSQQAAQSFTALSDTLLGFMFYVETDGSPTDNFIIDISSTLGGTVLGSIITDGATLPSTSDERVFTFTTPVSLTSGNTYYVTLRRSGSYDPGNRYAIIVDAKNNYSGGTLWTRSNNVWSETTTSDITFNAFFGSSTSSDIEVNSTGTVWNIGISTNMNLFLPNTDIILSNTSNSSITFAGGGLVYKKLSLQREASTATNTISASNTFTDIEDLGTAEHTFRLTSGTTQTISTLDVSGSKGNLITISSTSSGSPATLSKASGIINLEYVSIKDSTVTGGATWYARNSINTGGNTGWIFLDGNFLTFM